MKDSTKKGHNGTTGGTNKVEKLIRHMARHKIINQLNRNLQNNGGNFGGDLMKIEDIKLKDINKGNVFYYFDKKNSQIKEFKPKRGRIQRNSGYFLIPGKIKIADETLYTAILGVSSDNLGELFEVFFLINGKWVSQEDKNFIKKIKKKGDQIFPYRYHLNIKVEGDNNLSNQF